MLKVLSILLFCLMAGIAIGQTSNPQYDKALADSLGADEYGMKMYILVILKTGANKTESKEKTDSLFQGHMQNINHMVEAGKLIIAGPMQKNEKEYRGIFILNVKTIEEAKLLIDNDPAIKARLLDAEIYNWYGSAALPMYLKFHDKAGKVKF